MVILVFGACVTGKQVNIPYYKVIQFASTDNTIHRLLVYIPCQTGSYPGGEEHCHRGRLRRPVPGSNWHVDQGDPGILHLFRLVRVRQGRGY